MTKKGQATFIVSGKGLLISLVVVVITAVWMFILGIWVGRETAPIRFQIRSVQEELAQIDSVETPAAAPFDDDADIGEKKAALDFYEDLKKEKTRIPANIDPSVARPSASSVLKVKKRRVPPKPAVKPAIQSPKTTDDAREPAPESIPEAAPYTIQIASLKAAAAADEIIERLKNSGIDAFRVKTQIPGKGTWYRVRVGHFREKNLASPMVDRLKTLNFQPMVVKE